MAWLANATFASSQYKGLGITLDFSALETAAVGSVILLAIAMDNTGTAYDYSSQVTGITGGTGNTWVKIQEVTNPGQGAAGTGATLALWYCQVATQIPVGTVFTIHFASAITARCCTAYRFTASTGATLAVAALANRIDTGADPGSMSISGLTQSEYLFFRADASERSSFGYGGTVSYTTLGSNCTTGDTADTNMSVCGEFRILTGTGDATDPTFSAADVASLYIAMSETPPQTPPPPPPPGGGGGSGGNTTVTYTSNTTEFLNPERGLYSYMPPSFDQSTVDFVRTSQGCGFCFTQYDLSAWRNQALPASFLTTLQNNMNALRAGGNKCILRFSYSFDTTGADAPKAQLLSHLDQLAPYFANNVDVIAVMQAGFIGGWGEWGFSTNYGNINTLTAQNRADRAEILNKILSVFPSSRFVLLRYIRDKTAFYGTTALADSERFNGTGKARVGHHNDSFLSSSDDFGTYTNGETDKIYLAQETKWLPCGGESAAYNPPRSDCPVAEPELARFHYSFLNFSFHPDTISSWQNGGCMTAIKRNLGYRLYLRTAVLPTTGFTNGTLSLTLNVTNVGYAAPFNARPVKLLLKNKSTGTLYAMTLATDIRTWLPGDFTVAETLTIPTSVPAGTYDMLLHLPDAASSIAANPKFAIRLANNTIYDAATGYHDLGADIVLSTSTTPPPGPPTTDNRVLMIAAPVPQLDSYDSALVTTTASYSLLDGAGFKYAGRIRTSAQLRSPTPNYYETASPVWGHNAYLTFYTIAIFTNGWELIRFVHGGGGAQLANGSNSYPVGTWVDFEITQNGATITVKLNGALVANVVDPAPFSSGRVGYFVQDCEGELDAITSPLVDNFDQLAEQTLADQATIGNWMIHYLNGGTAAIRKIGTTSGTPPVTPNATIMEVYGPASVYGIDGGTGTRAATPWPARFDTTLTNYTVRNQGVVGATTTRALNGTNGIHPAWSTQMAQSDAGIVILAYGEGDLGLAPADFINNLRQLIAGAQAVGKTVVLMTEQKTSVNSASHMSAVASLANELGLLCIDTYIWSSGIFTGAITTWCPDGLHPSQSTYNLIADFAASKFSTSGPPSQGGATVGPVGMNAADWVLTFEDNFNGTTLDSSKWWDTIWYRRNKSSQLARNYAVDGGYLKIWPLQDWNSANALGQSNYNGFFERDIASDGKFSQLFGYFEAEIKMPRGRGLFPAFWLFNHQLTEGTIHTEADIMECYPGSSSPGYSNSNLVAMDYVFTLWNNQVTNDRAGHHRMAGGSGSRFPAKDLSATRNVYGMEWNANAITPRFNGQLLGFKADATGGNTVTDTCTTHNKTWYNARPMYFLLDLWLGRESIPNTSETPQGIGNSLEFSYVRAWRYEPGGNTGTIERIVNVNANLQGMTATATGTAAQNPGGMVPVNAFFNKSLSPWLLNAGDAATAGARTAAVEQRLRGMTASATASGGTGSGTTGGSSDDAFLLF